MDHNAKGIELMGLLFRLGYLLVLLGELLRILQ
jgi:hypothetical protein